jgi:Ran GTPase-activating protein (RanGAP) involved in mRNA processing and transport
MCTSDHLPCCLQLNLSANRLCGVWDEWDVQKGTYIYAYVQKGTYTSDGIQALADALCVSASPTKMLVGWNKLGDEGTAILCDALRKSTVTKVQELGLEVNEIGPEGAKAVAALCAAMASLTKIMVHSNRLGDEGATILCDALRESMVQELDLSSNDIGPEGAKAVAAMTAAVASLTSVR